MTAPQTASRTHAIEVDTELARIYSLRMAADDRRTYALNGLHPKADYRGRVCEVSAANAAHYGEILAKADADLAALDIEAEPFEAQYRAARWARYFLVKNDNGHVHSSTACNTCFFTTRFAWLIDLADQPVAEMIEEWGEKACTVCFPEAPTFPRFAEPSKADLAAKAAKAADKAERDAKKALTNLTAEQRFKGRWGWVETVAACKMAIREAVEAERYSRADIAAEAQADADQAAAVLIERGATQADIDQIITRKRKALGR